MQGGFVGVDVFFVISGFLITRLILGELQRGEFSLARFYERRARRLFPALSVTIAGCMVGGMVLFSPQHFERLGAAAATTMVDGSNVYFWMESGYFDVDAAVKPLLHAWSLCVEEQFYLVWPVFLLLLRRRPVWIQIVTIAAAGAGSLAAAEAMLSVDAAASFYLTPFRVGEFAIGALMQWVVGRQPGNRLWLEPLVPVGLALIAYPVLTYTPETPFPGVSALVPCAGTALLLYSGHARFGGLVLRNGPTVALGLVSYSWYLIHWPMFVFYRYYKFAELESRESWMIVAASLAVAFVMYRFVERPFRRRPGVPAEQYAPPLRFAASCALVALVVIAWSTHVFTQGGWPWRLPDEIELAVSNLDAKAQETGRFMPEAAWPFGAEDGPVKVLIVGDSHSIDLFNAVHLNRDALVAYEFRRIDLQPFCFYLLRPGASPPPDESRERNDMCRMVFSAFGASDLLAEADYVVASGAWSEFSLGFVPDLKAYLDGLGVKLVMLGRTPVFTPDIPSVIVESGRLYGIDRVVAMNRRLEVDDMNKRVAAAAQNAGAAYRDKLALVCNLAAATCRAFDDANNLTYHDADHWTLEGARLFGRAMVETNYFGDIIPVRAVDR